MSSVSVLARAWQWLTQVRACKTDNTVSCDVPTGFCICARLKNLNFGDLLDSLFTLSCVVYH